MAVSMIYIFDNYTGADIPTRVGGYSTDILLSLKTVSDVHSSIPDGARLFCLYTYINSDIVVQSEEYKTLISSMLSSCSKNYTIDVKENSLWYRTGIQNIILSDNVKRADAEKILLAMIEYITRFDAKGESGMYVVKGAGRKTIYSTSYWDFAVKLCNQSPVNYIEDHNGNVIYKSTFGKVDIPYKAPKEDTTGFEIDG